MASQQTSSGTAMPQIDTIVMLMMENRSLDSLLGWLYENSVPSHLFPANSGAYDGLAIGMNNTYRGKTEPVAYGTVDYVQALRIPLDDPGEDFSHVTTQLYNDGNGNQPSNPWSTQPPMSGFAFDYAAFYNNPQEVMGAYTPDQLPILNGLAANFAVSDRWFASVPTQTDANRAFSVCGTSLGGVDNGTPKVYNTPTVFNAIGGLKTFGIYWQYDGIASGDPGGNGPCYTANIFPQILNAVNSGQGSINTWSTFNYQAAKGQLPNFCYLEPYWGGGKGNWANQNDFFGIQGNDYHPPAWLGPAEAFLNTVYNTLVQSPQWPNMLFIITFDEHGGTYDHCPPTTTVAPDGNTSTYDFSRLGVRVPTILVSPYIQPGTVFRAPEGSAYDYDHTSLIATVLKWAGVDPASGVLGKRVAVAPTFEEVLSSTPSGVTPPVFTVPSGYASQGGGTGTLHIGTGGGDLMAATDPSILKGIDIREFRKACEETDTVENLVARLHELKNSRGK